MRDIKIAVIPAAGWGTRMFPLSISVPKELLPVLDAPALHLTALEAHQAGIEKLVLVISQGKEPLLDYFKPHPEIEEKLRQDNKEELLRIIHEPQTLFSEVVHVYQNEPLGLGHAVLCAKDAVGDNPFAVMLPDDIFVCDPPCLKQLLNAAGKEGGAIALKEVSDAEVSRYGIADGNKLSERIWKLNRLVEKPTLDEAPSRLAIMGRYVLPPEAFRFIKETKRGALGEIQLTDALTRVATDSALLGIQFEGERFDAGTVDDYIKTQLILAARDPRYRDFMKKLIG